MTDESNCKICLEQIKIRCSDCEKEDIEFHFHRKPYPEHKQDEADFILEEHGMSLTECQICEEKFCIDCTDEHARFEAFG